MEGTRFTPHLPRRRPGTWGTSAPRSLDEQEEGDVWLLPPFPQNAAFPCCSQFPPTPFAPPKTAASPPNTHTHAHTLLRIPGSGDPLALHPWPGVLRSFPAPSLQPFPQALSSASCPSPHFTHLIRTLTSSSQNSAPSLPPGSAQRLGGGVGTAGSLSPPDQIRVASAVLLLGKVVVVVGG